MYGWPNTHTHTYHCRLNAYATLSIRFFSVFTLSALSCVSFVPFYVQIMHKHTYVGPRQAATIAYIFFVFFLGRCGVRRCWCVCVCGTRKHVSRDSKRFSVLSSNESHVTSKFWYESTFASVCVCVCAYAIANILVNVSVNALHLLHRRRTRMILPQKNNNKQLNRTLIEIESKLIVLMQHLPPTNRTHGRLSVVETLYLL